MSFEFYNSFDVSSKAYQASEAALQECKDTLNQIDRLREFNQLRVIKAFQNAKISASDFQFSTGYGYNDSIRNSIEQIFAELFGAEKALVRMQFSSGTHVLAVMLKAILRPHDKFLIVSGQVYDTLHTTLGINQTADHASLKDLLIGYDQLELLSDGTIDYPGLEQMLANPENSYKAIYIQRSRGYTLRPALTNEDIAKITCIVKKKSPASLILVDNCYGEFVEKAEPLAFGADLIAGSLIKNPGGGIAVSGGYIAGRADLVELCAEQMHAPGVGSEIGPSLGFSRTIAQGIYLAPQVVANALKIAVHAAALFEKQGYTVEPLPHAKRGDIVQTIIFENPRFLISFCKAVQAVAPIDSQFTPEPSAMPGYDCDIIMASGSFTQGSSIELSADAPLRSPYAVFLQGGLNFEYGRLACMIALDKIWQEA
ncbi:MAG: aminotransferase class I/II-fold pyridoxal phosphate-dependent enzyme [Saccharofermentanales bacterium]